MFRKIKAGVGLVGGILALSVTACANSTQVRGYINKVSLKEYYDVPQQYVFSTLEEAEEQNSSIISSLKTRIAPEEAVITSDQGTILLAVQATSEEFDRSVRKFDKRPYNVMSVVYDIMRDNNNYYIRVRPYYLPVSNEVESNKAHPAAEQIIVDIQELIGERRNPRLIYFDRWRAYDTGDSLTGPYELEISIFPYLQSVKDARLSDRDQLRRRIDDQPSVLGSTLAEMGGDIGNAVGSAVTNVGKAAGEAAVALSDPNVQAAITTAIQDTNNSQAQLQGVASTGEVSERKRSNEAVQQSSSASNAGPRTQESPSSSSASRSPNDASTSNCDWAAWDRDTAGQSKVTPESCPAGYRKD